MGCQLVYKKLVDLICSLKPIYFQAYYSQVHVVIVTVHINLLNYVIIMLQNHHTIKLPKNIGSQFQCGISMPSSTRLRNNSILFTMLLSWSDILKVNLSDGPFAKLGIS